ncbi:MAG: hypothetical protein IK037_02025 [Clostridia bacterium]|nr:hypothetical protein [Clostridia bacterium]
MRGVKIVAILLLLLSIALLCFGCGESFTYTEYVDGGGNVYREFLFRYGAEAADAEEVKTQAVRAMQRYVSNREFEEYATIDSSVDGEVLLLLYFSSLTEEYIAFGYTGREENDPLEPTKKGVLNRYDVEFDSYLSESNINHVRDLVEEEFKDFPLTCDFYYTYGTTYKSIRSNGDVKEENGIYYHTWKIEYDKPANIVLTEYALNGVVLFSGIILLFVLSLAVIFAIIFINKKKNRDFRASAEDAVTEEDGAPTPKE